MIEVRLHQLLSDWLDQTNIGWKITQRGETNLIEKADSPDWSYYIGDDYISTYPSCGRGGGVSQLKAADPEFFAKLGSFLDHVSNCTICIATKEMIEEMNKSVIDDLVRYTMVTANAYALPPIQYSTIRINTDP